MWPRPPAILMGRILHPPASEIIQTFCAPDSLIGCRDGRGFGCSVVWLRRTYDAAGISRNRSAAAAVRQPRFRLLSARFGLGAPRVIPDCIPFSSIPHTTRLFSDFLNYSPEVRKFFPHPPDTAQVAARSANVPHGTQINVRVADVLAKH